MPKRHCRFIPCGPGFAIALSVALACPTIALAYRPFDGTDADVAELNKMEIEFQPVGAMREPFISTQPSR
jgi:hypothetical protein